LKRDYVRASRATICALILAWWAAGCAVALAPGYKTVKETRTIRFIPGSPSELRIHLHYQLKNSGTTDLPFLDINFPDARTFGRNNLRAEWDGREADLRELPEEYRADHPDTRRIAFEQPWARGRSHDLDIEYAFRSPDDFGPRITIGDETFHLSARGWPALPQPPKHFLSPYPARAQGMTYTVRVPTGFLVLARGKLKHRKAEHDETEYQFELSKNDLAPFVVAGRYRETRLGGASGPVIFWTLGPLAQSAGSGPARIANAWATLERDFGPVGTMIRVPHIVEAPGLRSHVSGEGGPAVASFPGGALVNEQTLRLGIASDAFLERVSHALAHNWFGDQMYPSEEAAVGLGEGLPEYATVVIDEAEGGAEARRKGIDYFLNRYNEARKQSAEKPLGVTMLTDPPGQRAIALAKAPLMYVALEDACGEQPVRAGLRRLVTLLSGQQVGFDDLRAAVEQTCGSDLGEFFRVWLYGKGLPADFERRYEPVQTP
jgi:hypothetical protein